MGSPLLTYQISYERNVGIIPDPNAQMMQGQEEEDPNAQMNADDMSLSGDPSDMLTPEMMAFGGGGSPSGGGAGAPTQMPSGGGMPPQASPF